jgi:YD repeat-containing protein
LAAHEIADFISSQTGFVYMEGGDVWYDPLGANGHNFNLLFGINCQYNSIGVFPGVTGVNNTFTQNMAFDYDGAATMIDYIDTTGGSQLIFKNTHGNHYGCGVASGNRTVGLSFELGGLVDTIAPSTKLALIDSIMDYFGIPPTGIAESPSLKAASNIALFCHPNPFRQMTDIRYQIPIEAYQNIRESVGRVSDYQKPELKIYDITGRLVRLFPTSELLSSNVIRWDGRDNQGRSLPQGVYFVRLSACQLKSTEKIVLLD